MRSSECTLPNTIDTRAAEALQRVGISPVAFDAWVRHQLDHLQAQRLQTLMDAAVPAQGAVAIRAAGRPSRKTRRTRRSASR